MTWVDETVAGVHVRSAMALPLEVKDTLLRAVREPLQPAGEEGRGRVQTVNWGDQGAAAIVRRCARGGLVRHVMKASYLFHNRPLAEFELHHALFSEGLPVTEPLGVAWDHRGFIYRGALATRRVEALSLAAWLQARPNDGQAVLHRVGSAIHALHAAGVDHGDLNAMNVLVTPDAVFVIDFDKSRRLSELSADRRSANLQRLLRSMKKRGLPHQAFAAICEGYGADPGRDFREAS